MSSPAADVPLLPRRHLTVGLTGHRLDRLGAGRVADVAAAVGQVLAAIDGVDPALASGDWRLVTGLADGADAIGADAALARGWRLDVVLPFHRDDYAADFASGPAREGYRRHLAACDAVFELPGRRDGAAAHEVAYERAGRVVLAQSDLLLAIWDGKPARGRGGAPDLVAEAVLQGIPVIHLDPAGAATPRLLWNGLAELDLGQQTVETVARADLATLPRLVRDLVDPPGDAGSRRMIDRFERHRQRRWTGMVAYPLLLAALGVRRPRLADLGGRVDPRHGAAPVRALCSSGAAFAGRVEHILAPRFARADAAAVRLAQLFRSGYVGNFALAALAVVVSLLGLALPAAAKPALIATEIVFIAAILAQTRIGNRAGWHRRWLDSRALAERLRCLAVAAQLGDLELRALGGRTAPAWVTWYARATARELGLPATRVDDAYLGCVRRDLLALIDDQTGYLGLEARRMHQLEHRLHRLGTLLFALTALACVALLLFKAADAMVAGLDAWATPLGTGATIVGAALPAVGAAIYGIRMQGDFAGVAERSHALAGELAQLRAIVAGEPLAFDTLSRRVRRVTGLLTDELGSWLQAYHARPLTLPG